MSALTDRPTRRSQIAGMLFASPYIIGFVCFLLIPLVMSLYFSFCNYPILQPPLWIGLDNYKRLALDPLFWTAIWNTLIFALASVPVSLCLSVLLAVILNRPVPGQGIFRTIVYLPSLVPTIAGAMLWLWLFNGKDGLVNVLLREPLYWFGHSVAMVLSVFHASPDAVNWWNTLNPPLWLQSKGWAMPAIIVMGFWGVGQAVVIFLAGLQDIPAELYEAAEIDGATGFKRLVHVTLPMLSPVILFNLIMGMIGAWSVFDVPYVMTGGGPDYATYFYNMYLYESSFRFLNLGAASAMAWVQFVIIMSLTMLIFATSRRWVHYR